MKLNTRTRAMLYRFEQGQTLQQIGSAFGITRERVRQLFSRAGISASCGGRSVLVRNKKLILKQKQDKKSFLKYGCSWSDYIKLRDAKTTCFFGQQRNNAKWRGIAWELSLWDWWTIWQSSGHWEERGRSKNAYVMCRFGDSGAYAEDNVYVDTMASNSSAPRLKSR